MSATWLIHFTLGWGLVGLPGTLFALFRFIHTLELLSVKLQLLSPGDFKGQVPLQPKGASDPISEPLLGFTSPWNLFYKLHGMAACPGDRHALPSPLTSDEQPLCDLQVPGMPRRAGMPIKMSAHEVFTGGKVVLRIFHPLAAHFVSSLLHRAPSQRTADISQVYTNTSPKLFPACAHGSHPNCHKAPQTAVLTQLEGWGQEFLKLALPLQKCW